MTYEIKGFAVCINLWPPKKANARDRPVVSLRLFETMDSKLAHTARKDMNESLKLTGKCSHDERINAVLDAVRELHYPTVLEERASVTYYTGSVKKA